MKEAEINRIFTLDINRNRLLLEAIREEYRTHRGLREKLERRYRKKCESCGRKNHGVDFEGEWNGYSHLCVWCAQELAKHRSTLSGCRNNRKITVRNLKLTKANIHYLVKAREIELSGSITEFAKLLKFLALTNKCCASFYHKYTVLDITFRKK